MFRSDFRREAWVGVFKTLFYILDKGESARNNSRIAQNSFLQKGNIYAVFHLVFSCFHDADVMFSVVYTSLYINAI